MTLLALLSGVSVKRKKNSTMQNCMQPIYLSVKIVLIDHIVMKRMLFTCGQCILSNFLCISVSVAKRVVVVSIKYVKVEAMTMHRTATRAVYLYHNAK